MIDCCKEKNAKKCIDRRTLSLIHHSAKTILKTVNRRLCRKLNEHTGKEQYESQEE